MIPYDEKYYDLLLKQVTEERVKRHYGPLVKGEIKRYEFPGIKALNFVMIDALEGGVTRSLCLDIHGKARSIHMLDLEVEIP